MHGVLSYTVVVPKMNLHLCLEAPIDLTLDNYFFCYEKLLGFMRLITLLSNDMHFTAWES